MKECTYSIYTPTNIGIASCTATSTVEGSQSSFFDEHGNILGWCLLTIWFIIGLILLIIIYRKKNITKKQKVYYSIGPILLFLLVITGIIYFFASKSKNRNMIFANISMIPLYLLLLIICFAIIIGGSGVGR